MFSGSHRRPLLILLAVGLGLRLAMLAGTSELGVRIADEQHYHVLATNLVEGRGFAFANGPTSLRPPLYPTMVAGIWRLTGTRSLQAVRAVQIILSLLTVIAVFALAMELAGPRVAIAAAALTCFYPSLLLSNMLLLTETLFALLVTVAAWAVVRVVTRGSLLSAAAAGLVIGVAALTRSILWPFPAVLAVLVVATLQAPLRRRLAAAAVIVLAAGTVMAPWAVRNTRLQGTTVVIDTMGGLNLLMGNYAYTPHHRIWDAVSQRGEREWVAGIPAAPPNGGVWTEGWKERWARTQAVAFMLAHPGLTAWRAVIKFGDFWGLERDFIAGVQMGLFSPPTWVAVLGGLAITVSYPVVLFLAIVGVVRVSPDGWRAHFVPLTILAFVCALHTIVFGHPRYRLPLTPLLSVYAGMGFVHLRSPTMALSRTQRVSVLAMCALFTVIWATQFFVRDWDYVQKLLAAVGGR